MKLFRQSALIVVLVSSLLVAMLPAAHAEIYSATMTSATCSSVTVFVEYFNEGEHTLTLVVETAAAYLGQTSVGVVNSGTTTLTFTFSEQPNGTHIYVMVYEDENEDEGGRSFEYDCVGGGPGCAIVPSGAVVGAFTENSETYWTPGHTVNPQILIEAGKTHWIAGQDASETYYKMLLACQWLWVRKETVGPNYDKVWNGAPLPTTIVE